MTTKRDPHYRSLCNNSQDYDRTIDYIVKRNPYAGKVEGGGTAEEFAINAVHDCIRSVVFGDVGHYCSTGGCTAIRLSNDPELAGYKKVVLTVTPR